MTQAAIKKLVADSIAAALEAQTPTMANTNRNTRTIGTLVARKGTNNHKQNFDDLAGVGPLSGKGPRVIVSVDASILPRLSSLAIRCIGPGPICVYYKPSPRAVSVTRLEFRDHISFCSCLVPRLLHQHLDAICAKYLVPEEVHPQLPSSDATMHERPAGKVRMYTQFFDYANYRIPFSTFFVSVLTHFRILFSQLSVFGSTKVSHFEILCRVCNIEPSVNLFRYFYTHNYKNGWFGFTKRPNVRACYSKNLDSVKNWNDHFFWVDEFFVPVNWNG
ncbi:hypothetical protein Tco_0155979 [Tanacetum coccineum]